MTPRHLDPRGRPLPGLTYYLDSMGRPKDGAKHTTIGGGLDAVAGRVRIHRRADAKARGVPYGTAADGVASSPDMAPAPTPTPTPAPAPAPPVPYAAPASSSAPPLSADPEPPGWGALPPEPAAPAPSPAPDHGTETGPEVVDFGAPAASDAGPDGPDAAPELTPEQIAALEAANAMVFGMLATAYGAALSRLAVAGTGQAPAPLRDDEQKALAGALETVAAHYLPGVQFGPLTGLLVVSGSVAMRQRADAKARAALAAETDDETETGPRREAA